MLPQDWNEARKIRNEKKIKELLDGVTDSKSLIIFERDIIGDHEGKTASLWSSLLEKRLLELEEEGEVNAIMSIISSPTPVVENEIKKEKKGKNPADKRPSLKRSEKAEKESLFASQLTISWDNKKKINLQLIDKVNWKELHEAPQSFFLLVHEQEEDEHLTHFRVLDVKKVFKMRDAEGRGVEGRYNYQESCFIQDSWKYPARLYKIV